MNANLSTVRIFDDPASSLEEAKKLLIDFLGSIQCGEPKFFWERWNTESGDYLGKVDGGDFLALAQDFEAGAHAELWASYQR